LRLPHRLSSASAATAKAASPADDLSPKAPFVSKGTKLDPFKFDLEAQQWKSATGAKAVKSQSDASILNAITGRQFELKNVETRVTNRSGVTTTETREAGQYAKVMGDAPVSITSSPEPTKSEVVKVESKHVVEEKARIGTVRVLTWNTWFERVFFKERVAKQIELFQQLDRTEANPILRTTCHAYALRF